jgi:hypothetical protein
MHLADAVRASRSRFDSDLIERKNNAGTQRHENFPFSGGRKRRTLKIVDILRHIVNYILHWVRKRFRRRKRHRNEGRVPAMPPQKKGRKAPAKAS